MGKFISETVIKSFAIFLELCGTMSGDKGMSPFDSKLLLLIQDAKTDAFFKK